MTVSPKPTPLPGDCLLYFGGSIFDWIIALKTWTKVAHCEVYRGDGMSVASRNGVGVNLYATRYSGLVYVLRPMAPFDMSAAFRWFHSVRGQRYDWLGLLCFTLAVKQGSLNKMFCSEFATRFYRAGGFSPFAESCDADTIAPAQFLQSPSFETVWRLDS